MSDVSDEASVSSSGSPGSNHSGSTLAYDHEPFETFQYKVGELARSICDCEVTSLKRIEGGGGAYNRVVLAELTKGGESIQGVFRFLRRNEDAAARGEPLFDPRILDQVAVQQYLTDWRLPLPRLLAYDASSENPAGRPYTFQEFSDGKVLDEVYEEMNLYARLSIARELAQFLVRCETVRFEKSGNLVADHDIQPPTKGSYHFDAESAAVKGVVVPFPDVFGRKHISDFNLDIIVSNMVRAREANPVSGATDTWSRVYEVEQDMRRRGYYDLPGPNASLTRNSVLFHTDLYVWNILAKANGDGSWRIDKVIDWDGAKSVPAVLARKPPVWLWDFDSDHEVDVDRPGKNDPRRGILDPEQHVIRQAFETTLVEGLRELYPEYDLATYRQEAYGKGWWVRWMTRFVMERSAMTPSASDPDYVERFVRNWRAHCEEMGG